MRTLDLIVGGFGTSWIAVADGVAKATIIFLTAGLASFLLRGRSAAMRHMVWTLALVGVLILPALSIALPRWQLDLVTIESASSFPLPASSSRLPASSSQLPASSSQLSAPSSQLPASGSQLPAPSSPLSASSAFVRTPASTRTLGSLPATLFGVWMIGALLILGRLVAGVLAVQW